MKKIISIALCIFIFGTSKAQDVEYKKGIIKVDGVDYARMEVKKQNFGLTKSFEVFSMSDEKIIIAAVATEFEADKSDNTTLYYRVTFLSSDQVGIFKVNALDKEKSFAKLIGNSDILVNGKTDNNKVKEFIARKSASPTIAVDYTTVSRSRGWPISIKEDKTIEQDSKIIGSFKPTGSKNEIDYYSIALPSGVTIAKLSFTGGNNAQNFELFTAKDNFQRVVPIPQSQKIIAASAGTDKNQFTLKRIVQWLIDNQYL